MAWKDTTQGDPLVGVVISFQGYVERREKPENPLIEQARSHFVSIVEYRGYNLASAIDFMTGSPFASTTRTITRSYYAIGGGGYNMQQNTDTVVGDWFDLDEQL
jgi:hypothetical protein